MSGRVRIGGRDIRELTLKSLRDHISFVLQDTLLFRTSIWENIAYGRRDATRAHIMRAAQLANDEFISRLPDGYDTSSANAARRSREVSVSVSR